MEADSSIPAGWEQRVSRSTGQVIYFIIKKMKIIS